MARFLQIAMGSAGELDYQLLLARDLNYLEGPKYEKLSALAVDIKRMLSSLMQKVKAVD
jgi:four helix bundle protein